MTDTPKRISNFIEKQLPEFVRQDHPLFVDFLEAYYEYLEQANVTPSQGKTVERTENLLSYSDIDTTLSDFSEKLYNEFLNYFPMEIRGDKKFILKHIKDFYRSKGSVKSFKFLFRAIFGEEIDIFYPKDNILRASDSSWFVEKSLNIIDTYLNNVASTDISTIDLFANSVVVGTESNAHAYVERTSVSYQSGVLTKELFISNQTRDFNPGETVWCLNGDGQYLTANVFSGILKSITVISAGAKYNVGDPVLVTTRANTLGGGATAYVSSVSLGNVANVTVVKSGAGFRANDLIAFTGDGTGANAFVASVIDTGYYHPATYNINTDIVSTYDNVLLNATSYGFPHMSNANANSTLFQAWNADFVYSNTGPLFIIFVNSPGQNYRSVPSADPVGNTRIKALGVIGKIDINNGGTGYAANDQLIFTPTEFCFGVGAKGIVDQVNANGTITKVALTNMSGFLTGGEGYDITAPPLITVNSAGGSGANLVVSAILAQGSPQTELSVETGSIGQVQTITIGDRGRGYNVAPIIDLTGIGDGTATAYANIVSGVYTYPGRFLDEKGMPSGFNFLQDRDYYQNFSYVLRVQKPINDYKQFVLDLVHPAGMKLWGEYNIDQNTIVDIPVGVESINTSTYVSYTANTASFTNANSYVYRNTTLVSTANSNTGTVSVWVNPHSMPGVGNGIVIFQTSNSTTNSTVTLSLESTGVANCSNAYVKFVATQNNNNVIEYKSNTTTTIIQNSWIHILSTWNTKNLAQTKLYINDSISLNVLTPVATSTQFSLASQVKIGADINAQRHFDGCMAEFWFSNSYIDIANTTIRRQFISSQLSPVNMGSQGNTSTGILPSMYFKAAANSFWTNYGTGGAFAINGSLGSCNSEL